MYSLAFREISAQACSLDTTRSIASKRCRNYGSSQPIYEKTFIINYLRGNVVEWNKLWIDKPPILKGFA